jgi:hypothetical protein
MKHLKSHFLPLKSKGYSMYFWMMRDLTEPLDLGDEQAFVDSPLFCKGG